MKRPIFPALFLVCLGMLYGVSSALAFGRVPEGADPFCYKKFFNFLGLGDSRANRNYYVCTQVRARPYIPVNESCGETPIYPGFKGKYSGGGIQTIAPRHDKPYAYEAKLSELREREREAEWGEIKLMPLDKITPGRGILKTVDAVDLEADVLGVGYCHKKNPTKAEEAFASGYDVPANFISYWTPEYLKFKWEPVLPSMVREYDAIDLYTFYELNLEAAKWWQEAVRCEGGEEMLRNAIAKNQWTCPALAERFISMQNNLSSYLASFFQAPPEVKPLGTMTWRGYQPSIDLPDAATMKAISEKYKYRDLRVPAMHPLVLHFFFGILFTTDMKETRPDKIRMVEGVQQLLRTIPRKDCVPNGIWPSNMAVSFRMYVKQLSEGRKITDTEAIIQDCTGERLPDFYVENDAAIYQQALKIYRQYLR